jgi:hypothetical protein
MCEHDSEMKNLLGSLVMNVEPDPTRMQATRERMMRIACSPRRTNSAARTALTIGLLLVGISAVGIAATQAGRDLVRWVFTPVQQEFVFTHESTVTKTDGEASTCNMKTWGTGSDHPLTTEERDALKAKYAEMDRIQEEGGGRLVGLMEGPSFMDSPQRAGFLVEYTLSSGTTETVGHGALEPKQKTALRTEEILALRDAGAGEIISQTPGPVGLGNYVIRFTLPDGQTVDLKTNYPPGTRQEREAIFAETRELKKQLRFAVEHPRGGQPDGKIWGLLHYTLADGRTVGISEAVPTEALTPDGKHVAVPQSEANKNAWRKLTSGQAEAESIMEAGGGELIGLLEGPNFVDGSSDQRTMFLVEFTLAGGQPFKMNEGSLSEKQRANMRWDEISALREAGAGQIISQEPFHVGLGKYTVRFTLSDGQTIDLTVNYPPGTREDREKIFAETRDLKRQLRFQVRRPSATVAGMFGILQYTLADGRTVGISEIVPKEAIGPDGKLTVPVIEGP